MRLVFVHADSFAFEADAPASEAAAESEDGAADGMADDPGPGDAPTAGQMDDCVVAFVVVERADAADLDATVANAAVEVRDVADHLDVRRLVLYPSAHLSDDPAERDAARTALRDLHADLAADFEVLRAPVDWYAAVEASWKGHPHAVTSRRVGPARGGPAHDGNDPPTDAVEFAVAFRDGEVADAREAAEQDRIGDGLRALLDADGGRKSTTGSPTSHDLDLLEDAGLANAPDRDDARGLRWSPRGVLVRDLVAERVTGLAVDAGAMPVETPVADARRTGVGASALPAVVRDLSPSEADLPLRLCERGGSATESLQSATTPAIYAVVRDRDAAETELRRWVGLCRQVVDDLDLDADPVVRTTREFYEDGNELIASLVADLGDPALLELRPDRGGDLWVEVSLAVAAGDGDGEGDRYGNGDGGSRPVEIAAVRLDAERLTFAGDDAAEASRAWVVRCAPVTGVERALAVLLERGSERESIGQNAPFPTWLAPTQVRLVPVRQAHVAHCDAVADDLEAGGVRVDVDDRDATVGERLARAERDRVPYLAVVGDREAAGDVGDDSATIPVTVRAEQAEREVTVEELQEAIRADVGDAPAKSRYLPRRVSEYPNVTNR